MSGACVLTSIAPLYALINVGETLLGRDVNCCDMVPVSYTPDGVNGVVWCTAAGRLCSCRRAVHCVSCTPPPPVHRLRLNCTACHRAHTPPTPSYVVLRLQRSRSGPGPHVLRSTILHTQQTPYTRAKRCLTHAAHQSHTDLHTPLSHLSSLLAHFTALQRC